jgi:hypothetical protein
MSSTAAPDAGMRVVADMQRWLERAVIGLNLCPFAKSVVVRGQVHWVVSTATQTPALEEELLRELDGLAAAHPDERDTTLLVVPHCLEDFHEFNLFVADANRLLKRHGLAGVNCRLPVSTRISSLRTRRRRRQQLHQPGAVSHPAPAARGQHRAGRAGFPRRGDDLRQQHPHAGTTGPGRLAPPGCGSR